MIGCSPIGNLAVDTLAKGSVEMYLIMCKLDKAKTYSWAIPVSMVGKFELPFNILDCQVTKIKMICHDAKKVVATSA